MSKQNKQIMDANTELNSLLQDHDLKDYLDKVRKASSHVARNGEMPIIIFGVSIIIALFINITFTHTTCTCAVAILIIGFLFSLIYRFVFNRGGYNQNLLTANENLTDWLTEKYNSTSESPNWKTISYIVDNRVKDKKELNDELSGILTAASLITVLISIIRPAVTDVLDFGLFISLIIIIAQVSFFVFNDKPGLFMWKTFAEDIHQVMNANTHKI